MHKFVAHEFSDSFNATGLLKRRRHVSSSSSRTSLRSLGWLYTLFERRRVESYRANRPNGTFGQQPGIRSARAILIGPRAYTCQLRISPATRAAAKSNFYSATNSTARAIVIFSHQALTVALFSTFRRFSLECIAAHALYAPSPRTMLPRLYSFNNSDSTFFRGYVGQTQISHDSQSKLHFAGWSTFIFSHKLIVSGNESDSTAGV